MSNEPVAWMNQYGVCLSADTIKLSKLPSYNIPLYTHPVKEELTDEEIDEVVRRWFGNSRYDFSANTWRQFSRAILIKAQE